MMNIYEYQAKELFRKHGIPVPEGSVIESPPDAKSIYERFGRKVVVKAQVHAGGRGKAGGVKLASTPDEAVTAAKAIIGMKIKDLTVKKVLVEEALAIDKEFYLGVVLDRERAQNVIMVSSQGGMDIEEVAEKTPEAICKATLHPLLELQEYQVKNLIYSLKLSDAERCQLAALIRKLYRFYCDIDATLVEINPLVLSGASFIAADGKVTIDDNALFRHKDFEGLFDVADDDPLEREAHQKGLAYVHLGGNIGIIGNGAGLVMGTLDTVKQEGGAPANFLDIGGGASASVMKSSLEIVLSDPQVKGIFINIFGGITRCDEVAKGIVGVMKESALKMPLVIKLCGTREEEGRAILKEAQLEPVTEVREGARKIVALVGAGSRG
ncbi:MAG: ADP-forming succinate--CoA ligase subunit beta [Candidatus Eremiobacteraeota bacterium]|nr:ADP-forming succinate--CoA ligase subunit beta [Candidatus Eremiobacteraeota bacterium]